MFDGNLKTMTKERLSIQIDLIEEYSIKKSGKHVYTGFYLEDEYCNEPEICNQSILGMGDADSCMFIFEKIGTSGQFYWCGSSDPYIISKKELLEKLWKIIQRDYQ